MYITRGTSQSNLYLICEPRLHHLCPLLKLVFPSCVFPAYGTISILFFLTSGHLIRSQFKAQLVSILDETIPKELEPYVSSSIMINVLGGAQLDSHHRLIERAKSMYDKDMAVYVHLYGKESRPGRKIGHITITGFVPIAELEKLAQPLFEAADGIRQERLHVTSETLQPQKALIPTVPATTENKALVLVTMGSDSDLPVLKAGLDVLDQFGVPWEIDITSAHRTPEKMAQVAQQAASKGFKIIIAAAGGAAHLPGMLAAHTSLPVIGIPVKATHLDGLDSLLSIVQMPVCNHRIRSACWIANRYREVFQQPR